MKNFYSTITINDNLKVYELHIYKLNKLILINNSINYIFNHIHTLDFKMVFRSSTLHFNIQTIYHNQHQDTKFIIPKI